MKVKCTGKRCPMQVGYDVENCQCEGCPYRTAPITNFDRIKAMSVDEMAKLIEECDLGLESKICFEQCEKMTGDEYKCPYPEEERLSHCIDCVKQWLESEVQGE